MTWLDGDRCGMMQQNVVYERNGWRVTSYGNGAAYLLEDVAQHKSVFFQYGDDASTFRVELYDAVEAGDAAIVHLFSAYSEVMR